MLDDVEEIRSFLRKERTTMLANYPLIVRAFKEIMLDHGGNPWGLDTSVEVPKEWVERFELVESVLGYLGDTLAKDMPNFDKPISDAWVYQEGDRPAWEVVAVPCDDDDVVVLKHFGTPPETIDTVREVFNEFFDGDLTDTFTKGGRG